MSLPQKINSLPMKIVEELTKNLDISDSMFSDAESKYLAVAKYLGQSDNPLLQDAFIYPQGSINLRTVVKPIRKEEFDIDLVLNLPKVSNEHNPNDILKLIGDRLKDEKSIYKDKVSSLKRGWRINYSGNFHLDITPSINNPFVEAEEYYYTDTAELVPDKELKSWKHSNPRGFEKWFSEIASKIPIFVIKNIRVLDSKMLSLEETDLESYTIEEIPDNNQYKGLLRRTIQLLKRHRDFYFNERNKPFSDFKPISVVITTLATKSYKKIIDDKLEYSCPFDMLKDIVGNMHKFIKVNDEYKIVNPTNENENFAEKWNKDDNYIKAFEDWREVVYYDLTQLQKQIGLHNTVKVIEESFGKIYAQNVIDSFTIEVNNSREIGKIASTIITSTPLTSSIKENKFFGAHK
ncbi:nucleotidyltransferase domain-containing protein [Aliarcobacter butzleri]|uniref:nucleotidyltransferase domain-containing protein n=1 Tax=Aliarcobacter butzleri TaxID=28197 RepID=UPI001260833F|nr:nucleotidyltransferase [Aliarcobacter butzleri]